MNAPVDRPHGIDRNLVGRWQAEALHVTGGDTPARVLTCAAAAALAATIFWIDTFTNITGAVAVLYVLVILLAGRALARRGIIAVAAACMLLGIASFARNHGASADAAAWLRLIFSLAALAVTAVLTLANIASTLILSAQARLLDVTDDAIILRTPEGRILLWNRGAERLYGWTGDAVLGRDARTLLDSRFDVADRDSALAAGNRDAALAAAGRDIALAAAGAWRGAIHQRCHDGRIVTVDARWQVQRDRHGAISTILETHTDITARKAADAALVASESRYRTIFDTLAVAVWEHDLRPVKAVVDDLRAQGVADMAAHLEAHPEIVAATRRRVHISDANETAVTMMRAPDKQAVFRYLDDFVLPSDAGFRGCMVAIAEGRPRFETQAQIRTMAGDVLDVIVALTFPPAGTGLERVQASIFDVTERNRMQAALDTAREELEQAMRTATLGEVSVSIAHEINQPLSAIRTSAGAARRWLLRDPPALGETRTALEDVMAAAEHAGEVVKRVRGLLTNTPTERLPVAIDAMVAHAAELVERELAADDVAIALRLAAPTAVVHGDRVLLQQCIINLVVNAKQAMASTADRRVTVVTAIADGHAVIAVRDSGPGFADALVDKAFDTFFTTKSDGMGLGLAICRSTVRAHDGTIGVGARPPEGGANIEIRLPLAG
ncbi:PAS domain-containing sensor histidine kinase [Polymorphobacter fuscus]|uniref:histidine kinase n=1 Tax=Sandarakinorhabdus fusca TaxID=1439888 RepID=A0A7C9KXU8_9SPHN|nr:ATP-binding protein [Polymorphobacter fuscus]KAB7646252.1 PAS domain S-box protein [Polymorphobacter fuscus]MQT17466.1 PAS domain S-box protein [Polymorphobacter fuscus]NJC09997.1 PAS domain S-box-containing protein [Polymorphobacter fuscus]